MALPDFLSLAPGLMAVLQFEGRQKALDSFVSITTDGVSDAATLIPEPMEPSCLSIKLVRTGVGYVITYCTLASVLFILTCILLLRNSFQDSRRRRLPIFLILCLSMVLGLLGSILNTVFWATLLIREHPSQLLRAPSYWLASTTMLFVTPLVTHVALIFRMASFYPPMLASRTKLWGVIALPIALKVLRIPWIILYLHAGYQRISRRGYQTFDAGLSDQWASTFPTVECSITLFDSLYTCVFLVHKFRQMGGSASLYRHNDLLQRRTSGFKDAVQQIGAATLFGFVVPTLWTVALLACVASPSISPTQVGYMLIANVFIQLLFTTLACLSRSGGWRDERYVTTMPDVYKEGWTTEGEKERERSLAGGGGGSLAPTLFSSRRPSCRSGQEDVEVPPLGLMETTDDVMGSSTATQWNGIEDVAAAACPTCRSRRAETAKRHASLALDFGLLGPGTSENRRGSHSWLPPSVDDEMGVAASLGRGLDSTGAPAGAVLGAASHSTTVPTNNSKISRHLNEYAHLGHHPPSKRPPIPRHRSQPGTATLPPNPSPSPVATFDAAAGGSGGTMQNFRPATADSDSTALNSEGWSPSRRGSAAKGSETSGGSGSGSGSGSSRGGASGRSDKDVINIPTVPTVPLPSFSGDPLGVDGDVSSSLRTFDGVAP